MIIILNLKGGLGNQLFQLISAYNFAERCGSNEIFIIKWNLSHYNPPRNFELDSFINNSNFKITYLSKIWFVFLNRYTLKLLHKIKFMVINENNYFKKIKKYSICILDDYFQEAKYTSVSSLDNVRVSINAVKYDIFKKVGLIYNTNGNNIGFHFRFTDRYCHESFCNLKRDLNFFDFSNYNKIFIFTDDLLLASKLFESPPLNFIFISDLNLTDQEEFILITLLPYFFVSNSTFSVLARIVSTCNITTFYTERDFELYGNNLRTFLNSKISTQPF